MGQKKKNRTKQLLYAYGKRQAVERMKWFILDRKFNQLVKTGFIRRTDNADLRIQL